MGMKLQSFLLGETAVTWSDRVTNKTGWRVHLAMNV